MKELENISESVKARLKNKAVQMNTTYNELLQLYVNERFLYRLSKSKHRDKMILKGALVFWVWDESRYRPTRDIDFLGNMGNRVPLVKKIIREICEQPVEEDGVIFDNQSINSSKITEGANYSGARIKLIADIGGAKVPLQLDIGFGDVVTPNPKILTYPILLDAPPPKIRVYPVETVIAEKVHSIWKLGLPNSRMKDYHDLLTIAENYELDGKVLQKAIQKTFAARNTILKGDTPDGLSTQFVEMKQSLWETYLNKNDLSNLRFGKVVQLIESFVMPIVLASAEGNRFTKQWKRSQWR